MTQRNISSYLPIFYVSVVIFSISVIHVSEVINERRHQREIKAIDLAMKKNKSEKKRKKSTTKAKKKIAKEIDSLSLDSTKTIVKLKNSTTTISDKDFFTQLINKNDLGDEELKKGTRSRTDIVIRYYKKEKDEDRVYNLRSLGFYIHERPAENDFDGFASNAIFYGDSVKKDDLIKIAYYLMNNGVKLQSMTLSKYHDAWKAHSVEIGTDTTVLNAKPFTLSTLRKKWEDM